MVEAMRCSMANGFMRIASRTRWTLRSSSNASAASSLIHRNEGREGIGRIGIGAKLPTLAVMCGRVRLSSDYSEIKIKLKFAPNTLAPNYAPDWNKPPTEPILVAIRSVDGERVPKMMRWGLLPFWAKDEKLSYSTFNARSEEFRTKPAFREAWTRGQRCLVVTDGFYEWKKRDPQGKVKQPFAIAVADGRPMVMAGLWDRWKDPKSGNEVLSCTVLTCGPNTLMGTLHDRMPVILAEADWPKWLGEEPAAGDELMGLLKPCPDEALEIWPVDKAVGNVKNIGPQLIKPLDEALLL